MKSAAVILAIAALAAGLVSAWYWYRTSRVSPLEPISGFLGAHGTTDSPDNWYRAASASARLNERAAIWTAATVILGAGSNLLGTSSN